MVVYVEERGRTLTLEASAFPVALGGPGAEIAVPGSAAPLAWLGLEGDLVFLQPAEGATVVCNDVRLAASHWLRDGDVLRLAATRVEVALRAQGPRLRVEHLADLDPTEPPLVLAPPPRGATVTENPATAGTAIPARPFAPRPIRAAGTRRRPFGRTTALVALGLPAALGLAFVLTARPVHLEVQPEPDRLSVGGGLALRLGARVLARPGRYRVQADRAGYRPLDATFEVSDAAGQTVRLTLEPLPGRLVVDTPGVTGAEILVDGAPAGAAPGPINVPAGEREVTVSAEGYVQLRTRLVIDGRGTEQRLEARLVPDSGEVTFESVPAGATVSVGGHALGTTPLTVPLSSGSRLAVLTLAGWKPELRRISVVAGQPLAVPTVRLVPADGLLVLASVPPGAGVSVDGAWRGETPLEVALAPGRAHEVRLTKAAHEPAVLSISPRPGERREETVTLAPQTGEVRVAAKPPDAELLVNGEPRGRADQTLRLPPAPHEIEVRRDGYLTFKQTVTPSPGFPQTLQPVLKSREKAREEAMPRVRRTGEGHDLRLVDGLAFRMGASRREPGRRANEPLRDVELVRPFYLSTLEVSNAQFRRFRSGHASGRAGDQSLDIDDYPVVRASWEDAAAYCNWLSERERLPPAYATGGGRHVAATPLTTGYRLPTEAEWERVARYPDGRGPLRYPWGPALLVPPQGGNYADRSAAALLARVLRDYDDTFPATAPVTSLAPNALGLYHLGGNVAEWTHDLYTITPSAEGEVAKDPTGPGEGEYHVIRGASWMHATVVELRLSFRDWGKDPRPDLGFRVARYAE